MGYLNICIRDILWISYSRPVCQGLLPPWEPCSSLGPGRHGPLRTMILCHCYAPLLSLRHRQAPQTRFAPPKLPRQLVDLVHVGTWRCFPFCPTRRLHLPAQVETWRSGAGGAGVGWSEQSCLGGTLHLRHPSLSWSSWALALKSGEQTGLEYKTKPSNSKEGQAWASLQNYMNCKAQLSVVFKTTWELDKQVNILWKKERRGYHMKRFTILFLRSEL